VDAFFVNLYSAELKYVKTAFDSMGFQLIALLGLIFVLRVPEVVGQSVRCHGPLLCATGLLHWLPLTTVVHSVAVFITRLPTSPLALTYLTNTEMTSRKTTRSDYFEFLLLEWYIR